MRVSWLRTVFSLRPRRRPICALLRPAGQQLQDGAFGGGQCYSLSGNGQQCNIGFARALLRSVEGLSPNGSVVVRSIGIDECGVAHSVQRSLKLSFAAC
jgi:hypothetical protein